METDSSSKIAALYSSEQVQVVDISGNLLHDHSANIRLKCKTKADFLEWLQTHQRVTGVTFRVRSTRPGIGKKVLYKAAYRCHRNTYPNSHRDRSRPSKKHTGCEAVLKVTIKAQTKPGSRSRSNDQLKDDFPTVVIANHKHNHNIDGAKAVICEDPIVEVITDSDEVSSHSLSPVTSTNVATPVGLENSLYRMLVKLTEEDKDGINLMSDFCEEIDSSASVNNLEYSSTDSLKTPPTSNEPIVCEETGQRIIDEVQNLFGSYLEMYYSGNPAAVTAAAESMLTNISNLKTESEFLSAMHHFGKIHFAPLYVNEGTNTSNVPRSTNVYSKKKKCPGKRLKMLATGKTFKKELVATEHQYCKR